MKKRFIALLLCCVMIFTLSPSLIASAAADDDVAPAQTGVTVSPANADLPRNEKVPLTAQAKDAKSFQWQIQAGNTLWVDISGETGSTIQVSYAMVASLLSGNKVALRCKTDAGVSNAVTVTVTAPKVEPQAESQAEPQVEPQVDSPLASQSVMSYARANTSQNDVAAYDISGTGETPSTTYNVVISYQFADGTTAADPYTASLAAGSNFSATVTFPTVQGYLPYVNDERQDSIDLNYTAIDQDYTYNVVYKPTNVDYTVIHYKQNLNDDNYTEAERETKQGLTNSTVPDVAKTYEGFYALLYEKPAIAADGSTVVEIHYDRYYYLMNFDLDGGYGVEPIYARYGAPISVDTPTKPGYTFESWTPSIPTVMPDHNTSYKASWKIGESGFTVVFWYENANDNGYSVAGTYTPADVKPGTQKKSEDYKDQSFTGRDDKHFTYNAAKAETVTVKGDGSTVLNVYFTRNTYTLTFKDGNIKIVCGKVEHEHSHEQCCTKTRWHLTCNSNKCPVGYEHEHTTGGWGTDSCYEISDLTITAKYQADIHGNFPIKDGNNTIWWNVPDGCESFKADTMLGSIDTMPGENIVFEKADSQSGAVLYYYIETLNGETGTYTHDGKSFKLYKQITLEKECQLTYSEEFHNITGFTQWWSDPKFDKMEQGGVAYAGYHDGGWFGESYYYINEQNYLCYTRNSYNLKFYNYNAHVAGKDVSVQFEAPLSSYDFTPEYPADLEKNAYVFAGWYTTAGCYEGSKADLNTMTMPASDVILYAKWVPVSHRVEFYLDKDALDAGTKLSTHPDITVPHGSKVTDVANPTNGSYTFVGWFYRENGVEKAFDFANMPVNKDLKVYGKWSSNTLMPYTIYYKIKDTDTEIAAPTTGSALAGVTKTFEAKGGTDLYAKYQEGFFPVTKSHSLTLDINATEENDTNVYTFWYVQKDAVPYTVKYLNKATGEPVATEKTVSDNRKAVVTETFVPVSGMMPDAYQKRLVVSAEEGAVNEIIFYYTEDTTHAYYKITHYTENLAKDAQGNTTWTEYASSQAVGDIGETYNADPMTIPGFTYDSTVPDTVTSGELTANGLELKLYYTRNSYPYQVRYLEQGTGNQLADPKNGTDKYGQVISERAIDIENYDAVAPTSQTLNIKIEESQTEAKLNIITFYYKEQEVTINYVVVGPNGCGTVSPTSETLKVLSGTAQGSTPTANSGFRFVGWYTDADCTVAVTEANGSVVDTKFTPAKVDGKNVAATYYAKFEHDITDLTITKKYAAGALLDNNQSAVFTVTGGGISVDVVIHGAGSVTIKGLKVGATYTVTEKTDWSWRYGQQGSQSIPLKADAAQNTVTFNNTLKNNKWLTGGAWCDNSWAKGSPNKSTSADYSNN